MNNILKYILFSLVLIFGASSATGQKIDYKNPPQQEDTYLFKVLRYHRQPAPPKYMLNRFKEILETPKSRWTAGDSLFYAYENVHLEKYELALSIFIRLNTDTIQEPHAQTLYRTTLQHLDRFEMLEAYNSKTILDNNSVVYSIKQAVLDLNKAYLNYKQKIFIPDSTLVFPILKNPVLDEFNRNKSPHNNKLVSIAFAIDSAFRHFTILHDNKDYILSQAFEEMGDFQKEYFYITNAHFYYSASRHYSTHDPVLLEKLSTVSNEMSDKNYIQISFKNYFGKVIKNRFRLNMNFKESPDLDSNALSNYTPPPPRPKKKGTVDYLPWIDNSILIIIIISLALIFVVFFMKVKKK